MHIRLIPSCSSPSGDRLKDALSLPGAGRLFQQRLLSAEPCNGTRPKGLFVPSDWLDELDRGTVPVSGFDSTGLLPETWRSGSDGLLVSNARLHCRYDPQLIQCLLDSCRSAVIAVTITPHLAARNELIRRTSGDRIVGIRRVFEDMIEPAPALDSVFPALLYFPPAVLAQCGQAGSIPLDPEQLTALCERLGISLKPFYAGGQVVDLDTAEGLLSFLARLPAKDLSHIAADASIHPNARLDGPVWVGSGVRVDPNALVVGPAILCDGTHIAQDTCIRNAVIGPNLHINSGQTLQNILYLRPQSTHRTSTIDGDTETNGTQTDTDAFRHWPLLSYPRLGKRIFDVIFAVCILVLISPVLMIAAVLTKLTSPGPIFYRARRQGRHGREFGCLKFRTMMVQAEALQDRLRIVNEVDGPQFKIDNDPRITGLGKFLRDTCIDELPQFFNVLAGQMSVVGPRPSPESENDSCPPWRDARLSVHPGITGLWQICRTREEGQDFQEWVHYDTQYVRNVSFRLDFWICLKTAQKLVNTFLDQFG